MSFMEAVKHVFSNYAVFSGRARRSEYWYFILFQIIVGIVLGVLASVFPALAFLSGLFTLATLVPSLAVIWRRMHDIGKCGAWCLVVLIPLVGWIFALIWLCTDGEPGTNAYGPSPKYPSDINF